MDIITKKEAIEKRLIFYFTGKLCKHGHLSERLVKGGACRTCKNKSSENSRKENREEYNRYCREKKREAYSTEKRRKSYRNNLQKAMFYAARNRAKNKNISFTLALEDVIIPTHCPVFGIPLDSRDRLHAPTLDRIINELGYIKGNVQVISSKANRLKNNGTIEEFKQIIRYMKNATDN
jgi:predicted transcriptional regulator